MQSPLTPHPDFHTAIPSAPGLCTIVSEWLGTALADKSESAGGYPLLNQIIGHSLGPKCRESCIVCIPTGVIRVTGNLCGESRITFQQGSDGIQGSLVITF